MEPTWQTADGSVRLFLGDCLDVVARLELESVGALVTDPPYGLGDRWNGGGGGSKSSWKFAPDEAQGWDSAVANGVEAMADNVNESIIWGGNYYDLPPSRCWLVWDKKQNDEWTTGQAELAWTNLDRPVRCFRFAQCEQANEGPKLHPTQKPLALMLWCMKWIGTVPVLDPFMGSGTTGVACVRTGRKFIGVEKEPKYFDIAVKRIEAELTRAPLFEPAPEIVQKQLL